MFRKEAVISELIETEEEYCRDLLKVVERYLKPLDGPRVPRYVSDKKDLIFNNFKEIAVFHNTVLLEGIKYYAKEPKSLGRTFLRMERDFDKHVSYCHEEPSAQEFLQDNPDVRDYFEDLASRLHDDKNLSEHLKLPIQRINDYQLLLKELIKYCDRLGEDTTDLNKALELMLGIPHRAEDLKYINNIEGFHGDVHKLGRLLRHNWFKVKAKDKKPHDRYLFLFKARILVCKVRKVAENRYVFILKEIIRLPEVELHDHKHDPRTFDIGSLTLESPQDHIKEPWIAEIKHYARNVLTLAEHAADDLRLQEEDNKNLEPLKGVELKLYTPEQSLSNSDDEMDKFSASRRTSLSRRVEAGGSAAFECEIDAKSVNWLKDNRPISDRLADRVTQMSVGNLHRLEILNVTESDAGVYTAHATTPTGQNSTCTANLVIQKLTEEERRARNAPVFLVKLNDTELLENTYLRFMVKVKGEPMPSVQFYKNNELITYENERIAVISQNAKNTGYYELVIPEVKYADAGIYKCVATNKFGDATCQGMVSVVDDKNIFSGLGEGKEIDPDFQWIKDGKPFDPEERFKVLLQDDEDSLALVFTHVKPEDAGLYTCVASTSTGKISCSAELTVQGNVNLLFREPEKPQIVSKHTITEANLGSSAMLETKITGYPKPDIKWMKDDQEILMNDKFKLLYEDEETIALVIKNVSLNDRGEYHVIATNLSGVAEDTINLDVKAAPSFTKKLHDVRTISGQEIRLTIEVDANPKPVVTWYKDGKEVKESDHIKLIEEGNAFTLFIEKSSLHDIGSYSVVCKNNISQISEFCKVDIEGAPIFTKNLIKRVETEEGDSLTFLVKVHGVPMPNVQWLYKDKPVVLDSRCKLSNDMDTYTLTINAITREDGGEYCCKLTNIHGTCCDYGKVFVKSRPDFHKGLGNVIAQEGDTNVGFSVDVDSFPKGKIQWFHNDKELSEKQKNITFTEHDSTYTLVLKDVNRDCSGKYTCKVTNDYGSNETSADLTVLCKPKFKKPLEDVTVNEGDTLTLRIEIDATPEPDVKWFKDGKELTSDAHIKISRDKKRLETYELSVTLVKAEDGGEYEVKALNEMGTAITKSKIVVQTTSFGDPDQTLTEVTEKTDISEEKDSVIDSQIGEAIDNETINQKLNEISKHEKEDNTQGERKLSFQTVLPSDTLLKIITPTEDQNDDKTTIYVDNVKESIESLPEISHIKYDTLEIVGQNNASKSEINSLEHTKPLISQDDVIISDNYSSNPLLFTEENSSKIEEPEIQQISLCLKPKRGEITVSDLSDLPNEENKVLKSNLENTFNESNILSIKPDTVYPSSSVLHVNKNDESLPENNVILEKEDVYIDQSENDKHEGNNDNINISGLTSNELQARDTILENVSPSLPVEITASVKQKCSNDILKPFEEDIKQKEEGHTTNASPQIISSQMKNVDIFETWEHTFEVEASGVPYPEAKWYKDDKEISSTERVKISDKNRKYKLDISDCQLSDTGTYKVILTNVLGEASDSANLNVVEAQDFRRPQILSGLTDKNVPQNQSFTYTVVLTADPVPEVKWEHDGKEITEGFTFHSDAKLIDHGKKECVYSVTIETAQHEHTGTYTLTATNKSGKAETHARLDVIVKPEINVFKDIVGIPYEDAQFVAKIRSNPRATILWEKDGITLSPNNHYEIDLDPVSEIYKLKIKGILLEDAGVYTVKAVNSVGECSASAKLKIHMIEPEFTKGLENITIRDYAQLDLKVRAQGVPKPEIRWSKDGIDLEQSEGMTLDTRCEGNVSSHLCIPHFKEEYAGKYLVRAYSLAGHADTYCYVKLEMLSPAFSKSLGRALAVEEGEPLELKCKIEASPSASIKWFKDGEELQGSDRIKITCNPDGSVKLRIDEATPADCGAYKIFVENPLGNDYSICAVAINPRPRAPEFIKKLQDVTVKEGEPMFLQAQITGFPLPELKWFKDGMPVRSSKDVNFVNSPGGLVGLSIDYPTNENSGNYTLTVSNKLGEASSDAKVEVITKDKKPEFRSHLSPTTVVEGFPLKLTVKVEGNPPPELLWFRNGSPIDIDGDHVQCVTSPDGSQSLIIDKISPLDAAVYSVAAKNDVGTSTSEAKVDVAGQARDDMPLEAPSLAYDLRDTWAEEGSILSISVPFSGNPIPSVAWYKDNEELLGDHRVTSTNDGKRIGLSLAPCEIGDIGVYKCVLKNPVGEVESEAKIHVKKIFHSPVFIHPLHDLDQKIGLDGKMMCRVSGNPRPDVAWFWNGKPIYEDEKYSMKREGDLCLLFIKNCNPADDGCYRCIASNRDGKAESEAKFRAVTKIGEREKGEAPCFLKKIGDQELVNGITGRFTACISGYPEPEVEWYRNDQKLYPSERIKIEKELSGLLRLSIANVESAVDAGKYKVRIFNDYGEDECEASFIFDSMGLGDRHGVGEQFKDFEAYKHKGAPMPLADRPIISRMTDRRLTLSWRPSIPFGPRDPVTYQVEMCDLPNGDWFTARSGIRSCACEIRNLEPFRDYKFRVRVENKFGISDPSPYAITYRSKLEPEPPKFIPYLAPGVDFRPESSPYFPEDFDIERPPHDGYAQAPRFLRQEHYTQYGVKGHNCNLFWFVYGYPKPKMTYYFNDEIIEMGGRYDSSYTRNGQATLFINKMLERDVGTYEAVATNEHGEARQRVHLEIAEYPEFIRRPDEITIYHRQSGRIEARVIGIPEPEIKWYKDWQLLAPSSRIKIHKIDPDHCLLVINDAILKDAGLYSICASNVAGAVSTSVMVHVEEKEEHPYHHYGRGHNVRVKTKSIQDYYDFGDELGRGTQGVTYHAVERVSGRNYAAKVMHGRGDLKAFMHNELEIMNILNDRKIIKIHDAFETLDCITLIMELASGGELLDALTRQTHTNESEIASYIRQLLCALDHMHDQNIAHLGLTPGDLLIAHPGGDDLKLCDFGLSRRIHPGQLLPLDYGMPEFVSPETIKGQGVNTSSDMWSVGVITYLLLTGISLFRGNNDMETLNLVKEGYWEFDENLTRKLSLEAKDFITKLLVMDPSGRLDVKAALRHPWLNYADRLPPDLYEIPTEKLHNYYNLWKDWYSNASCRNWYRRRPLLGAYSHPSRMVYPPHYIATPSQSPEREIKEKPKKPSWIDQLPSRQPINYETGVVSSESHYQYGPDTYLLQLRDVDFPVRIREYMKVASHRGTGVPRYSEDNHLDWRLPVIRERRRFMDVMDEEIDDERKNRINQYGLGDSYTVRRLRHELGSRLDTHVEAEAIIEATRDGQAPFMREKPQITPAEEGKNAELVCYAVGEPKPTIQWFKNDMLVGTSSRLKIEEDNEGRSILRFLPFSNVDAGIYKAVARNRLGQTVSRTRVLLASIPDAPDSPQKSEVSDTQVLLRWKQPKHDGQSPIVYYTLQYKLNDGFEWKNITTKIQHEFYLVRNLKPESAYIFRLSAHNTIGSSEFGIPSEIITTLEEGSEPINLPNTMKHLQAISEMVDDVSKPKTSLLDYSIERNPVQWTKQSPFSKYQFISEITRGRFSIVVKGIDKTNDQMTVAKFLDNCESSKEKVALEFEALRTLRHERIATLLEAYMPLDDPYCVFILEKLQGADVVTFLASRHEYTEQMVATIVTQILDGLQYLHWRGYCHLDLQPDNVVIASLHSLQVKLVDFGCAQKVSKLGNVVKFQGSVEFSAPEVLCQEPAYPQSDIWSVGVLTYVMLSGVSPFLGESVGETRQNINFVRYRFEHLYKELTQEATRFLMLLFKRAPNKRPSAEECHEHRWLLPSEYMIKRRERAVFLGSRMKDFSEKYHQARSEESSSLQGLTSLLAKLQRSNSIQEELITTDF
ncbi:obscurin isoform X2 [Halyomorpha halys]|uniref:obscurin isoform X2 n=1 Tax=Halyomorpha halys TaxID=286706 RepID=UPI0034D355C7